ncbi:DUF4271 domain-containing protein [Algoriphagus aquimarinus]|uniref:DUF4271 domain-containing protein n=1 Tax=Algoriphagus aquimarinus TaxID=237018 RepID=A0A1I0WUZ5_9BACT|nr:DUF4271 domain-containing protein [Algoriphagus aquimarinus]SFA91856.1 protein of unknown function [Algoriphagus aquimarinus]|tara:strand:- start:79034 stop:80155 length:1122 start_codon:yes stop_codon:yes gene_type:complete
MKKLISKSILIFSLFFTVGSQAFSQVLEDYNSKWEEGERETWFSSNDRLLLELDIESFPLAYFSFEFPDHSVVFVGEKLWFFTDQDTAFTEQVAEFKKEFSGNQANLTVFKNGISSEQASVKKILQSERIETTINGDILLSEKRGFDRQSIRDFFVLGLLISLLLISLYKLAYPFIFAMMIKPLSLLNAEDFSESGSLQKFFSLDILFYVFIVNMLLSLAMVTSVVVFRQEWLEARVALGFNVLIMLWIGGAFFLLILTIVKFTAIKILSYLFDLGKLEFPHFFYLLRLVVIATIGLILICAFFLFNEFSSVKRALELSFVGFFWIYILGILGLFLIMVNRLGFKKYHLFTYLCIAELVPFLILAKLVLDLGH